MTDTFTLRLHWVDEDYLYLGPVCIGHILRWEKSAEAAIGDDFIVTKPDAESARTALWDAAIEMLTKDEMK